MKNGDLHKGPTEMEKTYCFIITKSDETWDDLNI